MKAVIIGGSGHFEYALAHSREIDFLAYAPGSTEEDLSRLEKDKGRMTKFTDYRQMLEDLQPDLAISNPQFYKNAEIIETCLKRGVHCFCEKPLAFTQVDLDRVKDAYANSSSMLGTMMIHRYEPWFYAAKKVVLEGAIGKVVQIIAQKSYKMGIKPSWMRDKEKFGGIISWVGAHAIDLAQWFAPEPLELVSASQTVLGNNGQGDVESSASCLFSFGTGQAVTHMDYLRPENATTHGDDRIRIVGEDGIIEVMNSKTVLVSNSLGRCELPMESSIGLFDDFVDQIHGRGTGRLTADDAFSLAQLCIEAEHDAYKNQRA